MVDLIITLLVVFVLLPMCVAGLKVNLSHRRAARKDVEAHGAAIGEEYARHGVRLGYELGYRDGHRDGWFKQPIRVDNQ